MYIFSCTRCMQCLNMLVAVSDLCSLSLSLLSLCSLTRKLCFVWFWERRIWIWVCVLSSCLRFNVECRYAPRLFFYIHVPHCMVCTQFIHNGQWDQNPTRDSRMCPLKAENIAEGKKLPNGTQNGVNPFQIDGENKGDQKANSMEKSSCSHWDRIPFLQCWSAEQRGDGFVLVLTVSGWSQNVVCLQKLCIHLQSGVFCELCPRLYNCLHVWESSSTPGDTTVKCL